VTAFQYQAVPISGGKSKSGQIDADTPRHARNLLREQGLLATKLTETGSATAQSAKLSLSSQQLATLTRQFSALLDAGLTIDELLIVLADQADHDKTRQVLAGLRQDVMAGMPLSSGMEQFPRVFPMLYRTLVKAGEESGKLAGVMQRLADYLEARSELNSKIAIAFIYPAVVMFVSALVILGMLTWVVPQMVQVFESAKQTLPLLTRALLWTSAAVKGAGLWVLLAALVGGVAGFYAL
jgi:general secretion pathway protein F